MNHRLYLAVLLSGTLFANGILVNAQAPDSKSSSQDKNGQPTRRTSLAESDEQAAARRAFAVQVVLSLADEARTFKNESLRASVQARAADVLWDADQIQARTLFRKAWDAAETVDTDGKRKNEEEKKRFLSGRGGTGFIPLPPNTRAEVLRLAAGRDRAFAESFLARMEDQDKRDQDEKDASKSWDPTEPPEAVRKRLELARQLLENGETERAVQIAMPGLNRATSQGIIFLVLLRQRNMTQADFLFASMLERASADPLGDATAVSLLASYAFTPAVLATVTRNGLLVQPWTETLPAPNLSPQLRAMFFRVAAQILLRSDAELALTSAERAGTYFTILRLLPLFSQFYPDAAVLLQARLSSLASSPDQIIPEGQREFANAGFTKDRTPDSEVEGLLSRIERASTSYERDRLYAMAALVVVKKNDLKARGFADKIESSDLRKSVRGYVDFILICKTLEKRNIELVIQLVQTGEISPFQRAWAYTELASLMKQSAPERAQELIGEAGTVAKRIDASNSESPQAWVAIARRTIEIDHARTWELIPEIVKAANRVVDYVGEESKISVSCQNGNGITVEIISTPSISLSSLFEVLGREDFQQATDVARNLSGESPRAIALLAAARGEFKRDLVRHTSRQ